MAPPVYSVIPEKRKPEEEGGESEKGAEDKKGRRKKSVGRAENPPQFKLLAGSPLQFKLLAPVVQQKAAGEGAQGGGGENQLPAQVLLMMSNAFGEDFSQVKVVPNSNEAKKAGALAFAQGMELHFAPGQFNPGSPTGLALIGHELTHVVQQRQGRVQANTEVEGMPVNDDPALEAEADRMGELAAQSISTGMAAAPATPSTLPPVAQRAAAPSAGQQGQESGSGKQGEEEQVEVEEQAKDLRFSELPPADEKGEGNDGGDENKQGEEGGKAKPQQHKKAAQLAPATAPAGEAPATLAPGTVVDISNGFQPSPEVATYLAAQKKGYTEIDARYGSIATGKLKVRQKTKGSENGSTPATYEFEGIQSLDYTGDAGFLKSLGIPVVIAFNTLTATEAQGVLTLKIGNTVVPDTNSLIESINKNLEGLGLLGIEPLTPVDYTNKAMGGTLELTAPQLSTKIGGFADAEATFGLVGDTLVFSAKASIHVDGLAEGELQIERKAEGIYEGEANIDIGIKNVSGNVKVVYADGKITGRGTGAMESDKFKGSLTLIFDEEAAADQAVYEGMGIEVMEGQENEPPASNGKGPRVVAGFGSVEVQLTPWLSATAMVGIDSKGDVTIHGAMTFPDQVELMEQRDKQHDLFNVELKAGYGIPLVGQIFLFASLGMFVKAGFGPLALHDIAMDGTYSTSPKVPNNFKITGALGISAYAKVGLSVKAGAGLTLIGHDVKAGIDLTASAGIQAYAEARPTFDYIEKATDGQMVGEAHLKGHFEAAARLFLELAGAFFVDLDSPWWSPAPDKKWEWPFGSVVYPVGDEMGVAADVDWLVGSPEVPELTFTPVKFDPDKFLSDMTKEPDNFGEKGKGGDEEKDGTWTGDGSGGGENTTEPALGDPEGSDKESTEDLKDLPDEEKYMRALDEVGKIGDAAKGKPLGKGALDKKLKAIKSKYGLGSIEAESGGEESVMVQVRHKDQDNSNNPIEVMILSNAALDREFEEAVAALEAKLKEVGDPETGAVTKSQAETAAEEINLHYEVIEDVHVTVDEDKVVIKGEAGEGAARKMVTKPLAKGMGDEAEGGETDGKDDDAEVKSEADVTDADRKLHQEIAEGIREKLSAGSPPDKGDENYDSLLEAKSAESQRLIKQNQPKLRSGINLSVDFMAGSEDKQDNDIDFVITIAPNTTTVFGEIAFESEDLLLPPGYLNGDKVQFTSGSDQGKIFKIIGIGTRSKERAVALSDIAAAGSQNIFILVQDFHKRVEAGEVIHVVGTDPETWAQAKVVLDEVNDSTVELNFVDSRANLDPRMQAKYEELLAEYEGVAAAVEAQSGDASATLSQMKDFKKKMLVLKSAMEIRSALIKDDPDAHLGNSNIAFGTIQLKYKPATAASAFGMHGNFVSNSSHHQPSPSLAESAKKEKLLIMSSVSKRMDEIFSTTRGDGSEAPQDAERKAVVAVFEEVYHSIIVEVDNQIMAAPESEKEKLAGRWAKDILSRLSGTGVSGIVTINTEMSACSACTSSIKNLESMLGGNVRVIVNYGVKYHR